MRKILLFAMMLMAGCMAMAQVQIDGIFYRLDTISGEAEVAPPADGWRTHTVPRGKVVIPETVFYQGQGYKVTAVGDNAFCKAGYNIKYLTLPNSVRRIGDHAFDGSAKMEQVNIPEQLTEIGAYAFRNCGKIVEAALPGTLTAIGAGAFAFTGIDHLTVPSTVTAIGDGAFTMVQTVIYSGPAAGAPWGAYECRQAE